MVTGCGGILSDRKGNFQTPEYPNKYPYGINCTWTIEPPVKSFLVLEFIDFETELGHDFLKISDIIHEWSIGAFSGSDKPKNLVSSSNFMILMFTADESGERRGFNISYTIKTSGIYYVFILIFCAF